MLCTELRGIKDHVARLRGRNVERLRFQGDPLPTTGVPRCQFRRNLCKALITGDSARGEVIGELRLDELVVLDGRISEGLEGGVLIVLDRLVAGGDEVLELTRESPDLLPQLLPLIRAWLKAVKLLPQLINALAKDWDGCRRPGQRLRPALNALAAGRLVHVNDLSDQRARLRCHALAMIRRLFRIQNNDT